MYQLSPKPGFKIHNHLVAGWQGGAPKFQEIALERIYIDPADLDGIATAI